MEIADFNGLWKVIYNYETMDGIPPLMEARILVWNGRFAGVDIGGCTCAGKARIDLDGSIVYDSVWDASLADPNVVLPTPDGGYTQGAVAISANLKIFNNGTMLIMNGAFPFGPITIQVHATRIGALDG